MGDSLGDRMKCYENVNRNFLTRRIPVVIRLDGKAFHTFTRGLKKPFDEILITTMQKTMVKLCENIQGCVLGYTQSDEITLVLIDYQNRDTSGWFDYNIQKMASISASMATLYFNQIFSEIFGYKFTEWENNHSVCDILNDEYLSTLVDKVNKGAMFDSRVFNIPKEEVVNCLIWRQQDAIRNSIQSIGQFKFSERELHKKNTHQIVDMLKDTYNIDWENDYTTVEKRGSCAVKIPVKIKTNNGYVIRNKWNIDFDIPLFVESKNYIESNIIL